MAARWRDPSAFRADPAAAPAARPSRTQAVALLAVLAVVAAGVVLVSYLIKPEKARAFDLFHGSLFLADQNNTPVGIDLTSGKPTIRLTGAGAEVGIGTGQSLGVVPLVDATLLLNESTGEFNMVASTGDVVKRLGGGVPLAKRSGSTTAMGVATDDGQAYIVRTGATGGTDVFLVSQPTVESAISATSGVKPRASTSMPDATSTAAGGAVSANDDLWLLAGPAGGRQTVRQLTVPANSSAGARLRIHDHGTFTGAAALGVATPGAETPGTNSPQIVGVASADRIQVYAPGATQPVTVRFRAPAGVDEVLPASNAQDRLVFLLHGASGWNLLSVGTDGTGLRGPIALAKVPGTARLAEPAQSRGNLYTLDAGSGQIFRIGLDGLVSAVDGAPSYPRISVDGRVVEPADFSDAYLVARGPRVVFNSPTHADALMLFTDGSHPPLRIEKSSAVDVSAQGGAEALARTTINPNQAPSKNTGPAKPNAVAPVNNKIDCKVAKQKPHIPVLNPPVPGSRSVALSWSYTVLSSQDCYPSTYVLGFKLISNNAPSPPGTVTVQGQTGANVSGLFPSTQYEVWVTAYINGQGTASQPTQFTTGPEGPAAPTNLSVKADNAGNWDLSWDSCGSVQQGCVQAQTWTITPSFCDGRGVASPPAPLTKTADPTSKLQPPAVYQGSDALLGRGLRFQVQGTGTQGQAGTPSATSPCVYSWSPPIATDMSLQASSAPAQQLGQPTTATATLNLGSDPVRATGGVGATFTYQLLSGGNVVKTIGPTTQTTVKFTGVQAGITYQAQARVAPPRQASAAVTIGPVDVNVAHAPWPTITVSTSQYQNQGPLKATVSVQIGGLTSAMANGERFDLTSDSGIYCDNNTSETDGWSQTSGIDPANALTFTINRVNLNGNCNAHVQLVQDPNTGTSVFGAGTSSNPVAVSTPNFAVDPPNLSNVSGGDFSASWDGTSSGHSQIAIQYNGNNALIGLFATNWYVTVASPSHASCGSYPQKESSLQDVVITNDACVNDDGADGTKWTVTVSFTYFGATQGPYTLPQGPPGQAPTYANRPQCDPSSAGMTATWVGTQASPAVQISANNNTVIKDCTAWSYVVMGPNTPSTANCGTGSGAPSTTPQIPISNTCTDTPASTGWLVNATYTDLNNKQQTVAVPVTGPPPP